MCEHCEAHEDGDVYEVFAGYGHKSKNNTGFNMGMFRESGVKLEDSKFQEIGTLDNYIYCIEAWEWDKSANRHRQIAVEIQYCPFCGRKL